MIGPIAHVGVTVRNMEASIKFYQEILGLTLTGDMIMEGEAIEALTKIKGAKLRVVYFNSSEDLETVPLELIEFISSPYENTPYGRLNYIGIAEICFWVKDIEATYQHLKDKGVCFLSSPQYFDLSDQGYGKSKEVYFYDNNHIVLELMQTID